MARNRRREVALAAVIVLLLGTTVWRLRTAGAPVAPAAGPAPPASAAGPAARPAPAPGAGSGSAQVQLDALQAERPSPAGGNRNPFRFGTRTVPLPPSPVNQQAAPLTTGPLEAPSLPRIPLKFIGLVTAEADPQVGRVAILSDARGVYYGREGETVEGRYRIIKIGVESVELAYLDGRGRQTIRLTGQ